MMHSITLTKCWIMSKVKNDLPSVKGLKILCFLSFLGFVYCMAFDSSKFITYQFYDPDALVEDSNAYEIITNELSLWSENGIDVSAKGINVIALNFLLRSAMDVLALLGVALMFYRMKIGYSIYFLFQLLYVVLPFLLFSEGFSSVIPLQISAVNLIYVALFTTQRKHFISRDK